MSDKLEQLRSARQEILGDTPARKRLGLLFDPGTFVELDGFMQVDGKPSGVVCGYGAVQGSPVYAFAQDSEEDGGAVGVVHAAKICKLYDLALKTGAPVVGVYDSNGARVCEGVNALGAYGDILQRVNNLSGVVPQISLVLGTCAGTSALLAASADFVVMSEKAEFFMTPPTLTDDAQGAGTAQNAARAGVAHLVCADEEAACTAVRKLVGILPLNNLSAMPVAQFTEPASALDAMCANIDGADVSELVSSVCDAGSAVELLPQFGLGVYTAMATMAGTACGVVATRPGKLDADSCAKIAKVVSVCDSYQIPVLTFVNTEGFAPSAQAELCGSVRDMARVAHVYAEATTAKICVITGKAYGAAYVALCSRSAGADYTVAWPSAVISALEPDTAVAFLYSDRITGDHPREKVVADFMENEASPIAAAAGGAIDDVIEPAVTRLALLAALDILSAKRVARNPKKHANIPM